MLIVSSMTHLKHILSSSPLLDPLSIHSNNISWVILPHSVCISLLFQFVVVRKTPFSSFSFSRRKTSLTLAPLGCVCSFYLSSTYSILWFSPAYHTTLHICSHVWLVLPDVNLSAVRLTPHMPNVNINSVTNDTLFCTNHLATFSQSHPPREVSLNCNQL